MSNENNEETLSKSGAQLDEDRVFMHEAIKVALEAEAAGDIPVGAVVVFEGQIIARAGNARKISGDPTAHAEVIALRKAATIIGHWRLLGCTLYVTLEPCLMCAGAIVLSRVDRVVYGTDDPKAGAVTSLYQVLADSRLNHRPDVCGGVSAEECAALLLNFFRSRREIRAKEKEKRRGDREAEGA